MAVNLAPISTKQFLVTISGQSFVFQSKKGSKISWTEETYNAPDQGIEYKHHSFQKNDNLTLTKLFDPVADKTLITWGNTITATRTAFTVSVQPVSADLAGTAYPSGGTFIYTGCELVSITDPESDRDGSGLAKLELEISFQSRTYQ